MKLMHLSDLHLGKRVYEFSMIEDQRYILKQILDTAEREQVDGVLLAGDIYDKQVPSAEAVMVLDSFLTQMAEMKIPVFAISGNHDSAERIAFGAQLMNSRRIYLSPVYDGTVQKISLYDEYGEAVVYLLPFIRPSVVRHAYPQEEIGSYQDAAAAAVRHMDINPMVRNILVAHQFVTGASRCESEDVTVGGVDNVDAAVFESFDYVALGHIHSPQTIGRETVRYCGTPLKYSFSEAEQQKTVTIIELAGKGNISVRTMDLMPLHDMRRIRGTYMELTNPAFYQNMNTDDYILAVLTDEEDVIDGIRKLRVIYPNLMRLEYDNCRTRENQMVDATEEVERKSELELFEEFYELQNNQPMSAFQKELAEAMFEELGEAR